ncbi:hypothetical protein SUGI_1455470 [Cryptomeria japonica]|uniref:Uncharacterized protein n=1 Tax=Cryptomeria japonica TaxID=3369 RepID=A0AAD3NRW0_CRYJA|nr:hypothetical protein SUGI_1424780 [Cryptomeria japonica]GLJ58521.1 hypothetical protein SUGI_1455470 [Cryptomeria japonica]
MGYLEWTKLGGMVPIEQAQLSIVPLANRPGCHPCLYNRLCLCGLCERALANRPGLCRVGGPLLFYGPWQGPRTNGLCSGSRRGIDLAQEEMLGGSTQPGPEAAYASALTVADSTAYASEKASTETG